MEDARDWVPIVAFYTVDSTRVASNPKSKQIIRDTAPRGRHWLSACQGLLRILDCVVARSVSNPERKGRDLKARWGEKISRSQKEAGHNLEILAEQGNAEPFTAVFCSHITRSHQLVLRNNISPRGSTKRRAELGARRSRPTNIW